LRRARLNEASRRTAAELAGDGTSPRPWAVAATVEAGGEMVEIGTGLAPDVAGVSDAPDRRVVRINGETRRGQTALADHLAALWLVPDMQRLFTDGASARRRFLDRLVYAVDPAHAGRITAYDQTLRERARLLREQGTRADPAWVAALETALAERGVAIAAARADVVRRLNPACAAGIGPFPAAALALSGDIDGWLADGPALAAEDRMAAALAAARPRDADTGGAAVGPHRSDLLVTHLERGLAAALCSTGEQKALLISIVLANARILALDAGAAPLLLLDEVAAHLDERRRRALFEEIEALGAQAWMTGTDPALFAALGPRAQHLAVEEARVRPAGEMLRE
jgi:DNA replication and repair protein RecF